MNLTKQNLEALVYRLAQLAEVDAPVMAMQRRGDQVELFTYGGGRACLSLPAAGITVEAVELEAGDDAAGEGRAALKKRQAAAEPGQKAADAKSRAKRQKARQP